MFLGATQMKTIDRLIIGALATGVWVLVAIQVTSSAPAFALDIDADDIDGLVSFIEDVVEDCSVQGEAYIYSRDYAELEGVSISC